MTKRLTTALATAGLALAAFIASPAVAQDEEVDRECVAGCREASRDCRFDSREATRLCLEEAGCDILRDDYVDACFAEDADEETCSAAREAYRECKEPCREAHREAADACREAVATCMSDECGIDRPLRRHGRRGGHRRR